MFFRQFNINYLYINLQMFYIVQLTETLTGVGIHRYILSIKDTLHPLKIIRTISHPHPGTFYCHGPRRFQISAGTGSVGDEIGRTL